MTAPPTSIAIVGTGYVGLTTGACLAQLGHQVTCADIDVRRSTCSTAGEIPIVEDGLAEVVASARAAGRLEFVLGAATAAADADVVFLCVPTPSDDDGRPTSATSRRRRPRSAHPLRPGCVVVNKSTVPVGSTKVVEGELRRDDVFVVSNPEFLREGTALHDFLHPDRIVIGSDSPHAAETVARLYADRHEDPDHRSGVGGDDQVRGQRLPGDEDLVRQRRGGDVRGGRRRRRRRRRRASVPITASAPASSSRVLAGEEAASRRTRGRWSHRRRPRLRFSLSCGASSRSTTSNGTGSSTRYPAPSPATSRCAVLARRQSSASRSRPTPTTCATHRRSRSCASCSPTVRS